MEKTSEQVDTYEEIEWSIDSSSDESLSSQGENSTKLKRKRSGDDDSSSESVSEASSSLKLKKKFRKYLEEQRRRSTKIGIAEPLIRCAWTGYLEVWHEASELIPGRNYRLNAFLSTKTCDRARRTADRMDSDLEFFLRPRVSVWPESFGRSGPTDEAIALYLFPPSPEHEMVYDSLVHEMIRDDMAMSACVPHPDHPKTGWCDLIIFTSAELPWECRRYQGKFYLWGLLSC